MQTDDLQKLLFELNQSVQKMNLGDLTSWIATFSSLEQLSALDIPKAPKTQIQRLRSSMENAILENGGNESSLRKIQQGFSKLIKNLAKAFQLDLSENDVEAEKSESVEPVESLDVVSPKEESPENSIYEFDMELVQKFVSLQQSYLEDFEVFVLELEKGNQDAADEIRRYLHTLKGEFGVLDLSEYSEVIHEIEGAFEKQALQTEFLLNLKDWLLHLLPNVLKGRPLPVLPEDRRQLGLPVKSDLADSSQSNANECSDQNAKDAHSHSIVDDPSFYSDFVMESHDHIHTIEVRLLELETDPSAEEPLHAIFRAAHTIKGLAGFLELKNIQALSHQMEALMDQARNRQLTFTPAHVDLLLVATDLLKELVNAVEQGLNGKTTKCPDNYENIITALKKMDAKESIEILPNPSAKTGEILVQRGELNSADLNHALDLQKSGDERKIGEILIQDSGVSARSVGKALGAQLQSKQRSQIQGVEESVRVPVMRLDQLIDTIGEAVIAQSMIVADSVITDVYNLPSAENREALRRKVARAELIMRQIQELSMGLRMVSVKGVFQKMTRLVRDLAKKLKKDVEFVMEGENTELDKTVVENIGDPLVHMVRNGLDHGIETPEERLAAGKPAKAMLMLRAYHKAGSVIIEIKDDGRGLDREKILTKAIEKGFLPEGAEPSDSEVWLQIFKPGFSTASVVTDVSGRGVGMDVVRKNIESLRGAVDIQSEKGKGTTFTIRLPLTLAIIDGMVVRVGQERYIIPTLSIHTSVHPEQSQISTVEGRAEILNLRGELIPLVRMDHVLQAGQTFLGEDHCTDVTDGIVMVVEDAMGKKAGVLVDEILDQQQVVIKNLGAMGQVPGMTGGAIMNDGSVALIVDVGGILKIATEEKEYV